MGDPVARPVALNREDVALFQEMARWFRRHRRSMVRESSEWNLDNHAPEVYVARTPAGGIGPASGELSTGTGTGTGTEFGEGNSPAYANCTVYRVQYNGNTANLINTNITKRVLNLMFTDIPGNAWVLIHRDKWGNWFIDPLAGFTLGECTS